MDISSITKKLLANRGLIDEEQIKEFFNPTHPKDFKSPFDSLSAIALIKAHINQKNKIAIYGDYDVDGICSTAILWETLYKSYSHVFPHIPHRESEGYGLSTKGIDHCLSQGAKLIITVDNGIVAHKEIDYCRSQGCDIIVLDHHENEDRLPNANVILHSTSTCAAALTWFFCRDFSGSVNEEQLSLACVAVICDMVPLTGFNRSFAKYGLEKLNITNRPGLIALMSHAAIGKGSISPYEVGFMIGPRLNAMGRLEHAIDSLRLLCTNDSTRAFQLAQLLDETNKSRQNLTTESVNHALASIDLSQKILIVADASYNPGIIGLIASKIVEKYYRPAIAIAIGEKECKASARSVQGFHITGHIRKSSHLLLGVGGHAMAAGFTVETDKLTELKKELTDIEIADELLIKKTRVDMILPTGVINEELYLELQKFAPFGLGNPTPIFKSEKSMVTSVKRVGKSLQHSKLSIDGFEAMAFNTSDIPDNPVDIIYSIDKNTWNGNTKLQLLIKEIQSHHE